MDDTNTATRKPSMVFWIVGVVSLLWNSFGAYDYLMTMTRNAAWLGNVGDPQEMIAWIDRFPMWANVGYGLGIWGSVAGSLLLLLRSRHAATAFVVSLIGAAVSFVGQLFVVEPPAGIDMSTNKVVALVILAAIVLQWWWARKQTAAGMLR